MAPKSKVQKRWTVPADVVKIIDSRYQKGRNLLSILDLAKKAGLPVPLSTPNPLKVGIRPKQRELLIRNLPANTYYCKESDPRKIIEALAYEAHEWQALAIIQRANNTNRSPELLKKLKDAFPNNWW